MENSTNPRVIEDSACSKSIMLKARDLFKTFLLSQLIYLLFSLKIATGFSPHYFYLTVFVFMLIEIYVSCRELSLLGLNPRSLSYVLTWLYCILNILSVDAIQENMEIIDYIFTCMQFGFTIQDMCSYALEKRVSRLFLQTHMIKWLTVTLIVLANLNCKVNTQVDEIYTKNMIMMLAYEIIVYLLILTFFMQYFNRRYQSQRITGNRSSKGIIIVFLILNQIAAVPLIIMIINDNASKMLVATISFAVSFTLLTFAATAHVKNIFDLLQKTEYSSATIHIHQLQHIQDGLGDLDHQILKIEDLTQFQVQRVNGYQFAKMEVSEPVTIMNRSAIQTEHDSRDHDKCVACLESNVNTVFDPCLHGCLCYECAILIMNSISKCSLCRQQIKAIYVIQPTDSLRSCSTFKIDKYEQRTRLLR